MKHASVHILGWLPSTNQLAYVEQAGWAEQIWKGFLVCF